MVEGDDLVRKSLFLEGTDEPLLDGDAAMAANCAEAGANLVVVAPFEVLLPELAALVADGVLGRASGTPGRLIKHNADFVGRRSPLESCQAEGAARPVVDDHGKHQQKGQDWAREKGNQLVQKPAPDGTAVVSIPQTWFG